MKIYIVSIVNTFDIYHIDILPVHYTSSFDSVINFLKRAIEDVNSGIFEHTEIDVSVDYIDHYFHSGAKSVDRKTAKRFLEEGLTHADGVV